MDQRPDQLNETGWRDDRGTSGPDTERETILAETVEYDDADSETERIKAEIEDTRAEMGQTINEIQERLSPEHLMGQVKETVREATIGKVERVMDKVGEKITNVTEPAMEAMGRAGETLKDTGYSIASTVRQNPIACTLIGLGLGMYVVNRIRNADGGTIRTRRYGSGLETGTGRELYAGMGREYSGSRTGEYAGASRQYGSSKRGMFSQMKNTAGDVAQGAGEKVADLSHQAMEGARWAGSGLQRLMEENPLAVGAAAIAVGAAVGLVLPSTQVEHEYMGEASSNLMDKAQQAAREAMDKVKTVAQGDQHAGQTGGQAGGQTGGQTGQPRAGQAPHLQPQAGHGQVGQGQSSKPPSQPGSTNPRM